MATTYSALLAAARKRVHSPYSGPTPGELAAKVVLEYLSTNQAERVIHCILRSKSTIYVRYEGSMARAMLHGISTKNTSYGMIQVRRLVALNVDFECVLESVPGWKKGAGGTEVVRQHVRCG